MAVDKKFIINRQGKDYVLYAGLLQEAHRQFEEEFEITTEILELEPKPILRAKFRGVSKDARRQVRTSGIGAANRQGDEKSPAARTAPIEMAETRAKARALRDATNIGMTAFEELGGEDEEDSQPSEKRGKSAGKGSSGTSTQSKARRGPEPPSSEQPANSQEEPKREGRNLSDPESEPSGMDQPLANARQQKEIVKLCGELKPNMTEDEAVGAFEEKLGHPIGLLNESDAADWIAQFNTVKSRQRSRSSSGE